MDEKEKVKQKLNKEDNKLLYDPNQRFERRLGGFSVLIDDEDDNEDDEELNEIENEEFDDVESFDEETISEEASPDEFNQEQSPNISRGLPQKKEKASPKNKLKTQNKVKKGLKKAETGKKMAKAMQVFQKIGAFLAAHPGVIIVIIAIIFIIIIIFLVVLGFVESSKSSSKKIGLSGYDYYQLETMCENVYVYGTDGYDGTYPLEEYVAGVVFGEVRGFKNDVVYETLAIAARTVVLNNAQNENNGCSINGTSKVQVFKKNDIDAITTAVEKTAGLVLTKNGSIFKSEYDSFCFSNKDSYNYTLQNNLKIPVKWAEDNISYWSYLNCQCNLKDVSQTSCWSTNSKGELTWTDGGHGRGMSQSGAKYLNEEQGMTRDDILEFFYGDIEIVSIYESFGNGEYPVEPKHELYQGLKYLTGTSIESLLANNGMTVEDFNAYLKSVVEEAGVGTREAVVASAVSLIGTLANMGYRLNYQWNGKYPTVGVNPNWGKLAEKTYCTGYAESQDKKNYNTSLEFCEKTYKWTSFDCSGFVNWAIVNGFQENDSDRYQYTDLSNIKLNENRAVCEPGDVLVNDGHIMLIVGLDDINKQYIIAESAGRNNNANDGGVRLSTLNYIDSHYTCKKLDYMYNSYTSGGEDQ